MLGGGHFTIIQEEGSTLKLNQKIQVIIGWHSKRPMTRAKPIVLYHKHSLKDECYHENCWT